MELLLFFVLILLSCWVMAGLGQALYPTPVQVTVQVKWGAIILALVTVEVEPRPVMLAWVKV